MLRFKIEKFNGKIFILKAEVVKGSKNGAHAIWYKEDRFLRRWVFLGYVNDLSVIMECIRYHFGFNAKVYAIS